MESVCSNCGKKFQNINYYKRKYCTSKCYTRKGSQNPKWHGGYLYSRGYKYIYKPAHPNATKMGYVREHRLVMEQTLGRLLLKSEIVHHVNGIISDNSPSNLIVCASPGRHVYDQHVKKHNKKGHFKY